MTANPSAFPNDDPHVRIPKIGDAEKPNQACILILESLMGKHNNDRQHTEAYIHYKWNFHIVIPLDAVGQGRGSQKNAQNAQINANIKNT